MDEIMDSVREVSAGLTDADVAEAARVAYAAMRNPAQAAADADTFRQVQAQNGVIPVPHISLWDELSPEVQLIWKTAVRRRLEVAR